MAESPLSPARRFSNDTRPDARVARAASEQWGVFTLAELCGHGLSKEGVLRRVRRGTLVRIYPGVYALGWLVGVPEARWLAAVKACGRSAVLSHRAAALLWGFLEHADVPPEVTVAGPGLRRVPGIRVHRSRLLTPSDVTRHHDIPVTTPARTLIDLAAVLGSRALRQAVRRAQGRRRVSLPQLLATMDRLGPRRGLAKLRRIIAGGPAPTQSVLEDRVLDLLLGGGFEHPDVNEPLVLSGRRVIPDFRWPAQRLVIEADGAVWHDHGVAREDDAERQAWLEAHGERVIRITWDQAVRHPNETLTRVDAAGAPRPGRPRVV